MMFGALLAPLLTACLDKSPLDPTLYAHMDHVEDSVVLSARVELIDELPLPILAEGTAAGGGADKVDLKLLARVSPPVLGGVQLQASHVIRDGSRAYVSYNVRGDDFRGGLEIFDRINSSSPRLRAQARFYDTDVSAVDVKGSHIYLATATNDPTFGAPAVVEMLRYGGGFSSELRVPLTSYATTGIRVDGGLVYATSGSGGGLSVMDEKLNLVFADRYGDARAVDVSRDRIVAMRGTPGALRVYDRKSYKTVHDIPLGGASIPNSKSSLFVAGDMAFTASGDGGVIVADISSGKVVERLAPPPSGVARHLNVSNGLAWHEDLLFIANGEAGLWVAEAIENIDELKGRAPKLQYVGRLDLKGSANFVAVRGDRLFVATGLGGLHIVKIDD